MTLTSGFFNSVSEDRKYNAEDFSRFFDGILNDGVILGVGSQFDLTAAGNKLNVGTGRAWFNRTWTYNDELLPLDLPTASTTNPRIDTLVLTVDTRMTIRQNRLDYVLGTPAATPVRPAISPEAGVFMYPLGDIYRAVNSTTITQGNITKRIGTSVCPYATIAIPDVAISDNLSFKRSIVRGQYLGSEFTAAQKEAIVSGSFEGLYLGDYWTFEGTHWRIVDFDYWLGKQATGDFAPPSDITSNDGGTWNGTVVMPSIPGVGTPVGDLVGNSRVTKHHICVVPDDTLTMYANQRPFTTARSASNCGWAYSSNARNRMGLMANHAKRLFGNDGLLTRVFNWSSTFSSARMAMNTIREMVSASPMYESQILGTRNFALPQSNNDVAQFALYRHDQRNIWMGQRQGLVSAYGPFWTAANYSIENWTCMHDWAGATADNPADATDGTNHQFRPVIGITGE